LINKFGQKINLINNDILKIPEDKISKEKITVFGNLPYNISTEILTKWILNINEDIWFNELVLMFQKEVADRIIAKSNTSTYGRLSILSSWKLNVKKIIDINPKSFLPKPKIDSSLLVFSSKDKFFKLKKSKSLETITRVFFNQRRKMIRKPINQLFKNSDEISKKFKIDLNLRPQNLEPEIYFKLAKEYEDLRG
jgi:16S rRNA (adenine1518-N6/adenine1519-N6)-dimethyltransferase